MSNAALLAYAVALFLASISPGPAMVAIISKGLSGGARPALLMSLGVAVGDLLLVSLVILGLAAIAQSYGVLFLAIKYGGAAYLVWLGIRMWRAPPPSFKSATKQTLSGPLLLGAAIALGNPKAILFHASLMPLLIDLRAIGPRDAALVLMIVAAVNITTMGFYSLVSAASAAGIKRVVRGRLLNRAAGGAMVGTGLAIAGK